MKTSNQNSSATRGLKSVANTIALTRKSQIANLKTAREIKHAAIVLRNKERQVDRAIHLHLKAVGAYANFMANPHN